MTGLDLLEAAERSLVIGGPHHLAPTIRMADAFGMMGIGGLVRDPAAPSAQS